MSLEEQQSDLMNKVDILGIRSPLGAFHNIDSIEREVDH